jgi:hypothetical protein
MQHHPRREQGTLAVSTHTFAVSFTKHAGQPQGLQVQELPLLEAVRDAREVLRHVSSGLGIANASLLVFIVTNATAW